VTLTLNQTGRNMHSAHNMANIRGNWFQTLQLQVAQKYDFWWKDRQLKQKQFVFSMTW